MIYIHRGSEQPPCHYTLLQLVKYFCTHNDITGIPKPNKVAWLVGRLPLGKKKFFFLWTKINTLYYKENFISFQNVQSYFMVLLCCDFWRWAQKHIKVQDSSNYAICQSRHWLKCNIWKSKIWLHFIYI